MRHNTKAFTLAEVLITLGIIGVVAAMTIPVLMKNYNQKIIDTKFKKFYSTLNQAMLSVQNELGYVPACYYGVAGIASKSGDCSLFWQELRKQLRVTRTCTNAVQSGCMPRYNGLNTILRKRNPDFVDESLSGCSGFYQSVIDTQTAYVLPDGTIIFFYGNDWIKIIAFDVNGIQKPNKWGHDVFGLNLTYDGNYFGYTESSGGGCTGNMVEDGGRHTYSMIKRLFGAYRNQ